MQYNADRELSVLSATNELRQFLHALLEKCAKCLYSIGVVVLESGGLLLYTDAMINGRHFPTARLHLSRGLSRSWVVKCCTESSVGGVRKGSPVYTVEVIDTCAYMNTQTFIPVNAHVALTSAG